MSCLHDILPHLAALGDAGMPRLTGTWWDQSRVYIADIFVLIGVVFCFLASVGIIRMPDLYMRMQAATKAGTLGVSCIVVAAAIYAGSVLIAAEVALIVLFFFLTAPVATHLVARAAYLDADPIWDRAWRNDLDGCYDLEKGVLRSRPRATLVRPLPTVHRNIIAARHPAGRTATEDTPDDAG